MIRGATRLDPGSARLGPGVSMRRACIVVGPGRDVDMVDVEPVRPVAMRRVPVDVLGPGDDVELQVQNAASQCNQSAHPAEYT